MTTVSDELLTLLANTGVSYNTINTYDLCKCINNYLVNLPTPQLYTYCTSTIQWSLNGTFSQINLYTLKKTLKCDFCDYLLTEAEPLSTLSRNLNVSSIVNFIRSSSINVILDELVLFSFTP